MMIRTGILSVPTQDLATVDAVTATVRAGVPGVVLLEEATATHQQHLIAEILRRWSDEVELDLILTVGGTLPAPGPSPRHVTPEATLSVVERLVPGLPETMRMAAQEENPLALLDRGVAGIRGRTLIVNLPAGPATVVAFLEPVLDLLAPIIAHLHEADDAPTPETWYAGAEATDTDETPGDTHPSGLNAADFAAFLRRGDASRDDAS